MLIEKFDKNRHKLENVKSLLAMAVGRPTQEKLDQLVDEFYAADKSTILVAFDKGEVIGIIGLDYTDSPRGFITHIAVYLETRKQGVGSLLINNATVMLDLKEIEAETDQDAVGFYAACGFVVTEIESQWSEVRRFRCFRAVVE